MGQFLQDRASYFLDQSARDVPCRVRIAGDDALFSLSKWGGAASLAFSLGDEHRGRVEIAGNEMRLSPNAKPDRTHVFRKLDGERFEYDVVLLREPESNRISLALDFPDGLEFYRQPSLEEVTGRGLSCEPKVIDSYAVYWSGRNGAFKTGKFCHIYRPRIYDARGRSVWGRLEIIGKTLTITIPESWLADAAYPVVVDPVIGTQTRGALNTIDWWGEGSTAFYLEVEMGMSKFTASSAINGPCTSYIYSYKTDTLAGQAVLFSDAGNKPGARLSRDEAIVSLDRTSPVWVPSTFSLSRQIAAGETFWYGYNARDGINTYYDVGSTFQKMFTDTYTDVPSTFAGTGDSWSIIMSAYFSYSSAQSYTRKMIDTIGVAGVIGTKGAFWRTCGGAFTGSESSVRKLGLLRQSSAVFGVNDRYSGSTTFFRALADKTGGVEILSRKTAFLRKLIGNIANNESVERMSNALRLCASGVRHVDSLSFWMDLRRVIADFTEGRDVVQTIQVLIRFCRSEAAGIATVFRSTGIYRCALSALSFLERLKPRLVLRKEELIFVSRLTRELEFPGRLR